MKSREYLDEFHLGLVELIAVSHSEEERHEIFLNKRWVVETLVERVEIGKDREIKIIFRLNILEIVRQADKISEVPRA